MLLGIRVMKLSISDLRKRVVALVLEIWYGLRMVRNSSLNPLDGAKYDNIYFRSFGIIAGVAAVEGTAGIFVGAMTVLVGALLMLWGVCNMDRENLG